MVEIENTIDYIREQAKYYCIIAIHIAKKW